MDWMDYRRKLGIGFCDEEKFNYLLVNMQNFLKASNGSVSFGDYFDFCNMTGVVCEPEYSQDIYGKHRYDLILNEIFSHSGTIEFFLSFYVAFLNTYRHPVSNVPSCTRENYKNLLLIMLDRAHISYSLLEGEGDIFVFPKGAQELDDALVSQPLEWLTEYPNTYKTFVTALKQYSDGIYIRDVADNLRKSLESFLQEFLENEKNLETNKVEICKYLGNQDVDAGIAGLFQPLINAYKNINDRIAKHNDKVDAKLLEFLLYQTGVLIRMVISVKRSEEGIDHAD